MTVGVPDPHLWRRISTLEKQVASLEGLLRRMSLTRHVTPLNGRLWLFDTDNNMLDLDEVDTKVDITPESPGYSQCIEQIDLKGKRHYITLSGGGNQVAVTTEIIPGRVGTTPGGPIDVQRKKLTGCDENGDNCTFEDDGDPVPCYSWIKGDSTDPADEDDGELWIFIEQDSYGVWWFTGQDCPPGGAT